MAGSTRAYPTPQLVAASPVLFNVPIDKAATALYGGDEAYTLEGAAAVIAASLGQPVQVQGDIPFVGRWAVGDGASSSFQITHGLNDASPTVSVWDVSGSPAVEIRANVSTLATDPANTIVISAEAWVANPPATDSIVVSIVGAPPATADMIPTDEVGAVSDLLMNNFRVTQLGDPQGPTDAINQQSLTAQLGPRGVVVTPLGGGADDVPHLQAAFDAARARAYARGGRIRTVVNLGDQHFTCLSPLSIDAHFTGLVGDGAVLDFSSYTGSSPGLTVTGTGDPVDGSQSWGDAVNAFEGFTLKGPGQSFSGPVGLALGASGLSGNLGPAHMNFGRLTIRDWGVAIDNRSNGYAWAFWGCDIFNNWWGLRSGGGTSNAGESLKLYACTLFANAVDIAQSNSGSDIYVFGGSMDYGWDSGNPSGSLTLLRQRKIAVFSGRVYCFGVHFEDNNDIDWWFTLADSSTALHLHACEFTWGSSGTKNAYEFFYVPQTGTAASSVGFGGLQVVGGHLRGPGPYALPTLVAGMGRARITGLTNEANLISEGIVTARPYAPYARASSAGDPAFSTLSRWETGSSTSPADAPTVDATTHPTTSDGLTLNSMLLQVATNGHKTDAFRPIAVSPGQLVLIAFRIKTALLAENGDTLTVSIKLLDRRLAQVGSTTNYTFNTDIAAFTTKVLFPVLVPAGAASFNLEFAGVSWHVGSQAWISDLNISIDGDGGFSNPPPQAHAFSHAKTSGDPVSLASIATAISDVPQAIVDAMLPWRKEIIPHLDGIDPVEAVGTWAIGTNSNQAFVSYLLNTTHSQNDEVSFDVVLSAGTWNLSMLHTKQNIQAIATVLLDGVSVGTIDQYAATVAWNATATIAGIAVATTGKHRITIKAATRNASATDWYLIFTMLRLRRTA